MTNLEEVFASEEEALRSDSDYQLECFFLDIVENISVAMKNAKVENKKDLAGLLGVSRGRVSAFLGGYKKNPELRSIVQYAIALNVSPHDLCAPRKTAESFDRKLRVLPGGYESVEITQDRINESTEAARQLAS